MVLDMSTNNETNSAAPEVVTHKSIPGEEEDRCATCASPIKGYASSKWDEWRGRPFCDKNCAEEHEREGLFKYDLKWLRS